jgi:hypothetical protein
VKTLGRSKTGESGDVDHETLLFFGVGEISLILTNLVNMEISP